MVSIKKIVYNLYAGQCLHILLIDERFTACGIFFFMYINFLIYLARICIKRVSGHVPMPQEFIIENCENVEIVSVNQCRIFSRNNITLKPFFSIHFNETLHDFSPSNIYFLFKISISDSSQQL